MAPIRRRFLQATAGALLSAAALHLSGAEALADESWCDVDPPVALQLPNGKLAVVFVSNSGPVLRAAQLLAPVITSDVNGSPNGSQAVVRLTHTVLAPDGVPFAYVSEVWTGPARTGTLLSRQSGLAGQPLRHQFQVDQR